MVFDIKDRPIAISKDTKEKLDALKISPSERYETVLQRILEKY